MARPHKPISEETIYQLALIGCSYREMGAICGVDHTTIHKRFSTIKELGESRGNAAIRRRQMKRALEGSDQMLIHLGKQRLGQSDKVDVTSDGESIAKFNIHPNGRGNINLDRVHSSNGSDPVSHNGS